MVVVDLPLWNFYEIFLPFPNELTWSFLRLPDLSRGLYKRHSLVLHPLGTRIHP
ncbi:uncharacterized protein METZ01_LOCUS332611 [marine metagenome]|uniref:Uncharacterized protein n=1 Tax=marine metagenome TaxID=408172 RepID=A0A382Q3X5_9ZZZZ